MGMQRLSAKGLKCLAGRRIQERSLGFETGPVSLIPQQGMADVSEMHPDLVGPPRLQLAGEEARDRLAVDAGVFLQDLPVGYGFAATGPDGLFVACLGVAVDRCLNYPL